MPISWRPVVFLLLLLPAGSGLWAADLVWHNNWETAQAAAQASGKYLLAYVYHPSHAACVEMDRSTFQDPQVITAINNFEFLAFNSTAAAARPFCEKYRVGVRSNVDKGLEMDFAAVPAYLFLDASGREYYRAFGYYPPPAFLSLLQQVTQMLHLTRQLDTQAANPRLLADLGHLYLEMERPELGRPPLEQAVKLDPENRAGALADAELDLTILSIPDDPLAAFSRLMRHRFTYPHTQRGLEVRYFMAVAQLAGGRVEAAERILMDFAAIPPSDDPQSDYRNPWTVRADLLLKQLREPAPAAPPVNQRQPRTQVR